jgi:Hint domain/RTX calcium-binding nonapeptide repeat (4 copies)
LAPTANGLTGNSTTVTGTSGNDSLNAGAHGDTVLGLGGNDTLTGASGNDAVFGGDGNDQILGASGNDVLDGGAGNDVIDGGNHSDTAYGGLGNDSLIGGHGQDVLFGGEGGDTLDGGASEDSLDGGAGNDLLYGGLANDTLLGGDGADSLFGGDGGDLIDGGAGADYLTGGIGSDTFRGGIGDTIDGNEDGAEIDVLDLTGLGKFRLVRDPLNAENGTVQFLDGQGVVTGTMSYTNIETVVMCFTPGTRIATPRGERKIESLKAGDLVLTRDNGAQRVRWLGRRRLTEVDLALDPTLQPIRIRQGALGHGLPERDMMVSRQHRMLVTGPRAELLFGSDEVLVRAQHLTCLPGVQAVKLPEVTYLHLLFDRHEVVMADGAWSESFQPGERTLGGMEEEARDELYRIFPDLRDTTGLFAAARVTLKGFEARVLLAA